MSTAKMTLIGMYNYDNTLFDNLTMPTGINKNDVVNSLLLQGGEFEVLYPRPDFMKYAIGAWSVKWERTFAEWLRGTQASFNPIHNYDRIEDVRDEHRGTHAQTETADYTDARTANLTDKRTADLQDQRTADLTDERTADLTHERTADLTDERTADLTNERTPDLTETKTPILTDKTSFNNKDTTTQLTVSETEHTVAAYDSASYQPSSKDTINNGSSEQSHAGDVTVDHYGSETNTTTGTDTTTETGTDTTTHTGTDTTTETGTDTMKHTGTDTTNTTGTDTMEHTGTDNTRHAGTLSDVSGTDNYTDIHTAHMYGNIGVTTSAAMLSDFYKISEWNLLEHICDVFISELLIPVY